MSKLSDIVENFLAAQDLQEQCMNLLKNTKTQIDSAMLDYEGLGQVVPEPVTWVATMSQLTQDHIAHLITSLKEQAESVNSLTEG